ncbi:unnamed protein product [Polarella glacialis]|uniref:DNA (cytosine-5-)-methyltransferase n=1 Tax=Polarella glacialis TaxID=89957 RepID=A0A813L2T7_POLGL|nr:unnamed protein product [Polarella glacialis]
MPRLLELFSETGSVGHSLRARGWEVTGVDLDPKTGATIITDVGSWDPTAHEPGYFQCVWASCPCTVYSIALATTSTPRNLEGADMLAQKVQNITEYHKPLAGHFIENPQTGALKDEGSCERSTVSRYILL